MSRFTSILLAVVVVLPATVAWASNRWPDEKQAGPFSCHADFSLAGHQGLLNEIATLQHDVTRTLGVSPAREPVHLFLFEEKSTYQKYLSYYFPKVPYRRALYIKGRGPGMVFAHMNNEFEIDVRHESTHALLHAALPVVPLWLDEGLAEYFEVPAKDRPFNNPHFKSVLWGVRFGKIPRIDDLENIESLAEMGRDEYRNAWAWVHFMLHGPPAAREVLQRYLADLEAHTPPGRLSHHLRHRIPDLDDAFTRHFRSW